MRSAIEVARASGGTLHIVTAFGWTRVRRPDLTDEGCDRRTGADPAESLLAEFRLMASLESVRVETHPLECHPVDAITRVATDEGADLIVLGSKATHGIRHLSNVPKAVMDRAACAVLVV